MSNKFVDINSIQTDRYYLKLPLLLIKIPVAIVGVLTILGFLPMTIMVDEFRNTKCFYIHFKRNPGIYKYCWKKLAFLNHIVKLNYNFFEILTPKNYNYH